ncbi:Protein K10C2.1 [Aphelenchoides avenae]|nr:Protein K10C2.1 [Aphelenchus avenae]
MLYFESPRTVGYSFRDPTASPNNTFNDDLSALDNLDAISAFLERFPEYKARDFYIAGESYGGVYVPTLAKLVIEAPTSLPINLVGLAVGNGLIPFKQQTNSVVDYLDYEFLKLKCCPSVSGMPIQYCDFIPYLNVQSNMDMPPMHNGNPLHDKCADAVYRATQEMVFYIDGYDAYDHNQDCYTDKFSIAPFTVSDLRNMLESANYTIQHFGMTPFFKWYRDNDYPLNILVYNGDSDAVCNFLGAEWFVEALGFEIVAERDAWYYQQGQRHLPTVAGFAKKFRSG